MSMSADAIDLMRAHVEVIEATLPGLSPAERARRLLVRDEAARALAEELAQRALRVALAPPRRELGNDGPPLEVRLEEHEASKRVWRGWRLPPLLVEQLQWLAARRGTSVTAAVEGLLRRGLDSEIDARMRAIAASK